MGFSYALTVFWMLKDTGATNWNIEAKTTRTFFIHLKQTFKTQQNEADSYNREKKSNIVLYNSTHTRLCQRRGQKFIEYIM
jgi:hypothetical protein